MNTNAGDAEVEVKLWDLYKEGVLLVLIGLPC